MLYGESPVNGYFLLGLDHIIPYVLGFGLADERSDIILELPFAADWHFSLTAFVVTHLIHINTMLWSDASLVRSILGSKCSLHLNVHFVLYMWEFSAVICCVDVPSACV